MRNGLIIDDEGTQRWYLDDKLHRDENDLPATIWKDGSQSWWRHGLCHRDNGLPAIIRADGHQSWCRHGICHRENDLPAVIRADGSQEWYLNGKMHRENGPAIIWANGYQQWYINDTQIDVNGWIGQNNITTAWDSWDDMTWSLFRLEFL